MTSLEFLRYFITTLVILVGLFVGLFVYADMNPFHKTVWKALKILGAIMVFTALIGTLIAVWI